MVILSVVIPTHNRADVLPRAIDSVLNQIYDDFEVIVVDDGSTDDTENIVKSYQDSRVSYVHFDSNMGANAARNKGIQESRGDYVSFLDSDDEFEPQYLKKTVEILERVPKDVVGSFTGFRVKQGEKIVSMSEASEGRFDIDDLFPGNQIGTFSAATFKRSVFENVGYLDDDLESAQDLDFYIRVLKRYYMYGIDAPLVNYYIGVDGISNNIDSIILGQNRLLEKHHRLIPNNGLSRLYLNRARTYSENGNVYKSLHNALRSIWYDPEYRTAYYYLPFMFFGQHGFSIAEKLKTSLKKIY